MPRNVEVKIRVDDLQAIRSRALALGAADHGPIHQIDTYFGASPERGTRLKLREQRPGGSQLIAYQRPDTAGLRTSDFQIVNLPEPSALRAVLVVALGVARQVIKTRQLLLLGRTRIHLDRVEGLGAFLELEVVLTDDEEVAAGEREAEKILAQLELGDRPRLPGSYADL